MQRIFLYLPFQHGEDVDDQRRSVKVFDDIGDDPVFHWIQGAARQTYEIIETFGRFPHSNEVLGRQNSVAEQQFLVGPSGRWWAA